MKPKFNYYYRREARHRFVNAESIIMMIRGCKYERTIAQLRSDVKIYIANNSECHASDDMLIPSVHWSDGAEGYTGLVVVTLPFEDNIAFGESLREMVNTLPQVMCSFVGSSGRTLKVVIPYSVIGSDITSLQTTAEIARFHTAAHASAALFLLQVTGVKASTKDADHTKTTLMSFDHKAYYNPEATPIPLRMPQNEPRSVTLDGITAYSKTLLPDYNSIQMQMTKFNIVCRKMNINRESPVDEQLLLLANECRRVGIPEEVAVKCTLYLSESFTSHELLVRTTFENAYKKKSLGNGQGIPTIIFNQLLLRDFLKKRYLFRRNVITGSSEYMERNTFVDRWKPITDIAFNTICMAAHAAGIEVWDRDLRRYVTSELVMDYDPVMDWLLKLPQWDGVDRVAQIAAMVTTDTPQWTEHFRIWMRGMVSQWMNRGGLYGQSLVLMLIGGQGTGKSTFCKRLVPEKFMTYYNDRLDFSNKKEADRSLMRFLLICLDEYDQISRSHGAVLKNILQKSDVMFRKMYQDEIEQRRRYATFCATTNSMTPLTDPSGSRRYLCVNVTGDIDTTTPIDYEQLYAQVLHEVRRGEPCYLSKQSERAMQDYNLSFYQEQTLEMLVSQYVSKAEPGDDSREMTSLEVLQVIRSHVKGLGNSRGMVQQLGIILTQRGFPRRRMTRGWVYKLVLNE